MGLQMPYFKRRKRNMNFVFKAAPVALALALVACSDDECDETDTSDTACETVTTTPTTTTETETGDTGDTGDTNSGS
jgi:hypothetical protein